MAKKKSSKRVNKSAAIRAYLADHPSAGPAEVVSAMKSQGIEVTTTYVGNIKSASKKKRVKRKTKAATAESPAQTTPVQDIRQAGELLYQAVDLVMKAGLKEAKTMVEVAGKMVERINQKKK